MANVLKYKTSQPTKRALRKGNVALGIGEENYGPSSTTGYYSGIDVPEGGYVVYTLGTNNNPKAFVSPNDEGLIDIARTLGGGILDVLGSKNYLQTRANTWILDNIPQNKVTDGLVLDLNAKSQASFIDNIPTENLFGTTAMSFQDDAGIYTNDIISGTDSIGDYFIKDVNNAPWWSGLRIYNNGVYPLYAGVSYVFSFECRSGQTGWSWAYDSNASGGGWSGNDQGRLSNTNLVFDKTGGTVYTSDMANTWQRVSYRVTMKDASVFTGASAFPHDSFFTNTNNVQIYYRNPQLEIDRTTASSYTSGTRSQNTTIYDLSGNGNNGTLVNGPTFDSNGAIGFDGVNDYIVVTRRQYGIDEPWTTELVFKPTDGTDTSWNGLFGGSLSQGGYWMFHSVGNLTYYEGSNAEYGTRITYRTWTKANTFTTDDYHHLTIVYTPTSPTAGDFNLYYNGGEKIESFSWTFSWSHSLDMQFIGAGDGRYGTNNIHYFRQYDRALPPSEIKQNYYGGPIVTDGLVLAMDAGNLVSYESGSTTAYSMTGSLSGSLVNGVGYSSNNGGVWDFDGSNDYITQGPSSELDTNIFSVEAFAKLDAFDNNHRTIMSRNASVYTHTNGWWFGTLRNGLGSGNNDLRFFMWGDSGYIVFNEIGANDGKYHHVVITCDGVKGYFYIDGELKYSANKPSGNLYNSSTAMTIGSSPNGDYWSGNIPIARFYNKALTSDEVLQNFNAQKTRFGL